MWAYDVENYFSPTASKFSTSNICGVRVEYRVLTFQYMFKIKKKTTRMPEHNFKKFDVKCSELFSKLKKNCSS